MIESPKGPNGGFALSAPADEIYVRDAVAALERSGKLAHCVMGFSRCASTNPCPLHVAWTAGKAQLEARMTQATLGALQRVALTRPLETQPSKGARKR